MNLIETFTSTKNPQLTAEFGSTGTTKGSTVYGGSILYNGKLLRFVPFGIVSEKMVIKRLKFLLENIELNDLNDKTFECRVDGNSIVFNKKDYDTLYTSKISDN
jgi:hypothetical protein